VKPQAGTAGLLLLGFLLLPGVPASAEEILRVAVLQGVSSLVVSSGNAFRVLDARGKPLIEGSVSRALVKEGPSLLVNGRSYASREIVIRPLGTSPLLIGKTAYRGRLRIKQRGRLLVINELDVDEYLKGVLPMEISVKWHPEVLKVQAVISRTYALYQKGRSRGKDYDLTDSVQDQVYGGGAVEDPRTDAAVSATRFEILSYAGEPIFAAFHSTSAGPTEDAQERWSINVPYLKGVSCPRDQESPYYRWERRIDFNAVEQGLLRSGFSIGSMATLQPLSYSKAGRVLLVRIIHSQGELILPADELRKAIGSTVLPSTAFDLVEFGKALLFRGKGYGHGVGLCQWGAKVLAERGLGYRAILQYYYPGVTLESSPR